MKKETRLILALDETEKEKALNVAKEVYDVVDAIKVNYPVVLSCGITVVEELSKLSDVICDFKVADVPNTNTLIVKNAVKKGASGVIVHGFMGKDSVKACIDAAEGRDIFVVTEMSHPGAVEFMQPLTDKLAQLAVDVGATGVIAPGTRPERIKHIRDIVGDLLILSPGVGVQGGRASDAVMAGADYVIVGRSIYQSDNPRKTAIEIVNEIKGV
ncbi:MAG: orotidine-5'-phosphate decarboxylase [Thermoplasmatales archaeon]|nr:orotidine-5'-phosphate decarboxylase [Thermoplasmatales archaeon]